MDKKEIIRRLKELADHAVHRDGDSPYLLSLDDGIALHEAVEMLEQVPSAQPEETFESGKWYDFKRGYVLETTTRSFRILKDVQGKKNE